ncbi:c-type cytochrome biogenesis protein CcmI [uncultured Algimonas sp.]|uniref:c-type cytochrome biogenesis protein CcmI n=1 Tax=uncultured Algimonas sp. TaxID=1547920 RepID=UPI0026290943|nr:c-type cytochrome biogenesis protein CcmI [uncultured Algimonas sp.]
MIMPWIAFAVMAALAVAYLAPVLFADIGPEDDAELEAYFAQIDTVRADGDMDREEADTAIAVLQRQILARQTQAVGGKPNKVWSAAILAAVLLIGVGVYADQGTPLQSHVDMPVEAGQGVRPAELAALVAQLEKRLQTDRADDATGWRLYARSLTSLGRYEDALRAFDRAVALSGSDPDILAERERAVALIRSRATIGSQPQRGPTAEDIRNADALSEADRAAMIQAMVDSLAERLEAEPDDPDGWARLLRARIVLGQREQAEIELARVRELFDAATANRILESADWEE